MLQILRPNNMIPLSTPTNNISLNMDLPARSYSKIRISIGSNDSSRLCHRKWLHVQHGNSSGRWQRRRVKDNLQVPRYEPILVDRMVAFGGDDIETDVVRFPICQDRNERCKIEIVCHKVKCPVRRYRSGELAQRYAREDNFEWEVDRPPCSGCDPPCEDHSIADSSSSEKNVASENGTTGNLRESDTCNLPVYKHTNLAERSISECREVRHKFVGCIKILVYTYQEHNQTTKLR